jgi:chromosome segregation ATPase
MKDMDKLSMDAAVKHEDRERTCMDMQNLKSELSESYKQLQKNREELEMQIRMWNEWKAEQEDKNEEMKKKSDGQSEENENLIIAIGEMVTNLENVEKKNASKVNCLEEQLEKLSDWLSNAKHEISLLRITVLKRDMTLRRTKVQIESLQAALQASQAVELRAKQENGKLKSELGEKTAEVEAVRQENVELKNLIQQDKSAKAPSRKKTPAKN